MRTTDWHDSPRMFGLAHSDLGEPSANDFEVVAWPLQSRPPTHVFGSWGTGSSFELDPSLNREAGIEWTLRFQCASSQCWAGCITNIRCSPRWRDRVFAQHNGSAPQIARSPDNEVEDDLAVRAPQARHELWRGVSIVRTSIRKSILAGQPWKDDACSRTNSATVNGGRPVRSAIVLVIVTVLPPARW